MTDSRDQASLISTEPSAAPDGNGKLMIDLYRQYWRDICGYIQYAFGDGPPEPEDVAQQAFVNFSALKNPEKVANPRAFLRRIAYNIVISEKRRAKTRDSYVDHIRVDAAAAVGDELTPERVFLERERMRIVNAALVKMPKRRRRILLLHRIHGLSYAEIARRLGVSQTGVKKHVARAIRDLDEALKSSGLNSSDDGS